jgi:hypothetical protein
MDTVGLRATLRVPNVIPYGMEIGDNYGINGKSDEVVKNGENRGFTLSLR